MFRIARFDVFVHRPVHKYNKFNAAFLQSYPFPSSGCEAPAQTDVIYMSEQSVSVKLSKYV